MISLTLRSCGIVAALFLSISAKTSVIGTPVPDIGEEDDHDDFEEMMNTPTGSRALQSRIVGGTQADFGKYPYFVQWKRGCGASLIHSDMVLTAAHCNGSFINLDVIVSAYERGLTTFGAQARKIVERIPHPNYRSATYVNDFMVMRLDSPVTGIIPVALNADSLIPANGDVLSVMGFGDLASGSGTYPTFLQEVDVPFVPHSKCNVQYSGQIDETSMICAGFDEGGKDSCQGDSGGPIVRIIAGVHTQVGVVSWGQGCALPNRPGVYSRVSAEILWIQNEVCLRTKTVPKPAYCTNTPTNTPTGALTTPTRAPTRAPTRVPTKARRPRLATRALATTPTQK